MSTPPSTAAQRLAALQALPEAERVRWQQTTWPDTRLRAHADTLTSAAVPPLRSGGFVGSPLLADLLASVGGQELGPGDRIGSVTVVEAIGDGGMGRVFRGFDARLERTVAIKAMHPALRMEASAKRRLRDEARLLSRLNHPGICQIYDLIEAAHGDYLLLEFVDGRTLRQLLETAPPFAERLRIARALVAAVLVAHQRGIVHRDLKPDNVMVTDDGAVKVLDFGISLALAEARERPSGPDVAAEPGPILGTPAFMSPEQARGEPVGVASDIFSLGRLLRQLFDAEPEPPDPDHLLDGLRRGEVPPPRQLPPALAALDAAMLAADPVERPTAGEVLEALDALAAEPLHRRRRRWMAGAALVALLALAASAALSWRMARPPPLLAAHEHATLALLPIANATGTPDWDWVSTGLTELVARQLDHLDRARTLSSARLSQRLADLGGREQFATLAPPRRAAALGVDLVIEPRALLEQGRLRLEYRSLRRDGAASPWRGVVADEPSDAADLLARALALRLAPETPAVELRDRFSLDPLLNRLYAIGLDRLAVAGGQAAEGYFRVCLDRDPEFGWARLQLGQSLFQSGDALAAGASARAVQAQAGRSGDRPLATAGALLETLSLAHLGELERAEALARRALDAAGADDASALRMLGQVVWQQGRLAEAERLLLRAAERERAAGDKAALAHTLRLLGVVADEGWQLERAVALFEEALATIDGLDLPGLRAMILNGLGISLHYSGQLDRSQTVLEEALAINQRLQNPSAEASNLSNLGDLHLRREQWHEALAVLQPALAIFERVGNKRGQIAARINLGQALIRLGRLGEAESQLDALQTLGASADWNALGQHGQIAYARGRFAEGLALMQQARAAAGPNWQPAFERILEQMQASVADRRARDLYAP